MSTHAAVTIPRRFWAVAGAGLVWTLIGVMTYIMSVTMTADTLLSLPEAEQTLIGTVPSFVTGAYAIAVFSGLLGCVALLLRKRWSTPLFALSLIAILIQMGFTLLISKHLEVYGPTAAIVPILVILVAIYLAWFSRMANSKGWLS